MNEPARAASVASSAGGDARKYIASPPRKKNSWYLSPDASSSAPPTEEVPLRRATSVRIEEAALVAGKTSERSYNFIALRGASFPASEPGARRLTTLL